MRKCYTASFKVQVVPFLELPNQIGLMDLNLVRGLNKLYFD